MKSESKKLIKGIAIASVVSILIGLVISFIFGVTFNRPITTYLWSAGYSMSIGVPLFANGFLFRWFEKKFINWIQKPMQSIFAAFGMHMLYSSLVILGVNWFWFVFLIGHKIENFWSENFQTIISEYIAFILIATVLYAKSFFKAWRNEVEQKEKAKSEALALQYKVLQEQVNPHFLFNSLNVLNSLIDFDVEKAKQFTHELSMFYRDVLHFKNLDIIPIQEEIDFVKKYIYLQQIRFGEALQVDILIKEDIQGSVIPLSLQLLVENAIKHNEMSMAAPLKIIIGNAGNNELIVENNLQLKKTQEQSSQTGLKNLTGRYKYFTGKEIEITQNQQYFRVNLPLIQVTE